ncbi:MAG: copper resistance CopC family protein [Aeromicrobium sp.]
MPKPVIAAVFATMVFLVALSPPAAAHASLVSTDPADGSTVKSAPRTIQMNFNEGVRLADVSVSAPNGGVVGTAEPTIDGVNVSANVGRTDQRGEYTVAYRVVSEDGHTVSGEFRFTTTTGQTVETRKPPAESPSSGSRSPVLVILGIVGVLGAVLVLRARQREKRS